MSDDDGFYDERTFLSFFEKQTFDKIPFLPKNGYGLPLYEMITARWIYNFEEARRLVDLSELWPHVSEHFKVKLYQYTRNEFEICRLPSMLKLMWDIDRMATLSILANGDEEVVEKYLFIAAFTSCREMMVEFSRLRGIPTFIVLGTVELFNNNNPDVDPIDYEISSNARGEYLFAFERKTNELTSLGNANAPSFKIRLPLATRSVCSSNGIGYGITEEGTIYKFDVLALLSGKENVEFLDFDEFFLAGHKFLHCEANDEWRIFLSCEGKYYQLNEEEVLKEISVSRGILNFNTQVVSYIQDRSAVFAYVDFNTDSHSKTLVYDIIEQGKVASIGKMYNISGLKKVNCVYFDDDKQNDILKPCLIYETNEGKLQLLKTRDDTVFNSLNAYMGPFLRQGTDGTLYRHEEPFYETDFMMNINLTSIFKIILNDGRLQYVTRDSKTLERILHKNERRLQWKKYEQEHCT